MEKIKEIISGLLAIIFGAYLLITYLFGMYTVAFNENYSAKQLIAGGMLPPYAIYVGTTEIYNNLFKSYDLYPYSVNEILTKGQIIKLQEKGYSDIQIEREAYISLVSVLNHVKGKYRTKAFLEKFHNRDISFEELKKFTN